jgi:hypothetical protein
MSPEQFLGEEVTDKTDMYSFGLLGYELLTGESPYDVTSPIARRLAHLNEPARPLAMLRPDADPALASLLEQCLAKEPSDRPVSLDVSRRLAHSTSMLLEWPPPGLESLHGALHRPATTLLVSGYIGAIPLTLLASTSAYSVVRFGWPQVLLYPLIGFAGFIGTVTAIAWLERVGAQATNAMRAGYGWGTMLEVLCDERRDTGALITGEREYSLLTPERRRAFRTLRVVAQLMRLAAGAITVAGAFVVIPLAARLSGGPDLLALTVLGLPVVLQLTSILIEGREIGALRKERGRLTQKGTTLDRLKDMAAAWRDGFRTLTGSGGGPGGTRHSRLLYTLRSVAGVALIAGSALTVAALSMPVFPQIFGSVAAFAETAAINDYADARRMIPYAVRPDPAVTPVQAGEALHMISIAGGRTTTTRYEVIPAKKLPHIAYTPTSPEPGSQLTGGDIARGSAMRLARHGLSKADRAYLRRVADVPGIHELETLARAAEVDYVSAVVRSPVPRDFRFDDLPGVDDPVVFRVSRGLMAQAILDFADGKNALAEQHVREVVSAGLHLSRNPHSWPALSGPPMVAMGRANYVELLTATGRGGEAVAMRSGVRDPRLTDWFMGDVSMDASARARYRLTLLRDSTTPPFLRWDVVRRRIAFEPCTDLRQMIFGADDSYRRTLNEARQILVHQPGDEILMRSIESSLDHPREPIFSGGFDPFARFMDRMTGSRRFSACLMSKDWLR